MGRGITSATRIEFGRITFNNRIHGVDISMCIWYYYGNYILNIWKAIEAQAVQGIWRKPALK